jgi:hypothetical protein
MSHLLNLLTGMGAALNPFGTAPSYHVPKSSDRSRDGQSISRDMFRVVWDADKKVQMTLAEDDGKNNARSGER